MHAQRGQVGASGVDGGGVQGVSHVTIIVRCFGITPEPPKNINKDVA
jgi:hypothetical protein